MYRKLLGGTAIALALAASPALAADLSYPVKAPPVAIVPVFSWTGFYLGANVGYGWGDGDGQTYYYDPDFDLPSLIVTSGGTDPSGWFGGFQAGYNYQFYNNVVLGIEADVEFADMKDTYAFEYTTLDLLDNPIGVYGTYRTKVDAFGTIRGRLGYAYDRFLPYITGGLAWANVEVSGSTLIDYNPGGPGDYSVWSGSYSDTYWGWALGAGVEYAFTDNWTMKAEYIWADVGSTSFSGLFNDNDLGIQYQTLKVGVNYKF